MPVLSGIHGKGRIFRMRVQSSFIKMIHGCVSMSLKNICALTTRETDPGLQVILGHCDAGCDIFYQLSKSGSTR